MVPNRSLFREHLAHFVNKNAYICLMKRSLEKYKGIHPGIILGRELKLRSIKQRPFALALSEHPQTFNAITKGKRNLNTALALKIEKELGFEEGSLVILQAWFDIKLEKERLKSISPDLDKLRPSLFWDTDIQRIDWIKQYKSVVQRVFDRGNEDEKKEITQFYGIKKIELALGLSKTEMPTAKSKI